MVVPFIPEIFALLTPRYFQRGVGVLVAYASQALKLGSIALQRRLLVTLEIRNKDPSYDWFLTWLALQTKSPPKPDGRVRWARSSQLSVETRVYKKKTPGTPPLI